MAPTIFVFYVGTGTFFYRDLGVLCSSTFTGCLRWSAAPHNPEARFGSRLVAFLALRSCRSPCNNARDVCLVGSSPQGSRRPPLPACGAARHGGRSSLPRVQRQTRVRAGCWMRVVHQTLLVSTTTVAAASRDQVFYSGTFACTQCSKECSHHPDDDARMFVLSCGHLVCARRA